MKPPSVVLGVDPGTGVTGYGVVRSEQRQLIPLDFGCIRPKARLTPGEKYRQIFEGVTHLVETHRPDAVAVETQYIDKNVQSALKLGRAQGIIVLVAALHEIPVFEYAPTKAKRAVVGIGRASKAQVQAMVQRLLRLSKLPQPDDAADALALAICHFQMSQQNVRISTWNTC